MKVSHVQLFATPWTVAYQSLPSMGFSRQEYWSGLPFSSPGDLPNPGIEPRFPASHVDSLPIELSGKPPFCLNSSLSGISAALLAFAQVSFLGIILPYTVFRRRQWQPTPVLLPGKSHGWKSLVGCSPWCR